MFLPRSSHPKSSARMMRTLGCEGLAAAGLLRLLLRLLVAPPATLLLLLLPAFRLALLPGCDGLAADGLLLLLMRLVEGVSGSLPRLLLLPVLPARLLLLLLSPLRLALLLLLLTLVLAVVILAPLPNTSAPNVTQFGWLCQSTRRTSSSHQRQNTTVAVLQRCLLAATQHASHVTRPKAKCLLNL